MVIDLIAEVKGKKVKILDINNSDFAIALLQALNLLMSSGMFKDEVKSFSLSIAE